MEIVALASSKYLLFGPPNPTEIPKRPLSSPYLPSSSRGRAANGYRRIRYLVSAHGLGSEDRPTHRISKNVLKQGFANISSSSNAETFSVGTPQFPVPPPTLSIGSPLFWIGVGVGLSALFSWVTTNLKNYAMKQALNTLMSQMASGGREPNQAGVLPEFPYPFPATSTTAPTTSSPKPSTSQPVVTVDIPATKVEATPAIEIRDDTETRKDPKRYAFVDVSPEEVSQKDPYENSNESFKSGSTEGIGSAKEVSPNGTAAKQDKSASEDQFQFRKAESVLSVEALEKMMDDPTVQKMVYPYLPEEMRNPTTFKWMLQNPQYRQQLQDMLNNMGGSSEWDSRMMDSLKSFDLSSPEVKQQFDQIGLTPEEVISKIMANPEVAMAFQNPKVQAAIMDCSQNPLSITKYQNDKEVMDVFNKISELFPGATGSL